VTKLSLLPIGIGFSHALSRRAEAGKETDVHILFWLLIFLRISKGYKIVDTYLYTCHNVVMKSWTSRDILRILEADGWTVKHQVGSHIQLVHPLKPGKVTVPHPKKDLAEGTVKSIIRQAGLNLEDLK